METGYRTNACLIESNASLAMYEKTFIFSIQIDFGTFVERMNVDKFLLHILVHAVTYIQYI